MQELGVTSKSKWNEFEAKVQERFTSEVRVVCMIDEQIIAGKNQRDLFYDYVDKMRNREEKEIGAIQAKLRQDLYDLFEEYWTSGRITVQTK